MGTSEVLLIERRSNTAQPSGPAPRSLGVNFAWALAGNGFYSASQWAVIVILAKLGDAAAVGRFALALAICSPILIFTNVQLRTIQATEVGVRFRFGHYVSLRLLGATAFLLGAAVVAFSGRYDGATLAVLGLVAMIKTSESFSDVGYGLLHSRERMDLIAQSQILKGVASVAAMLAAVAWSGSCLIGMVALGVVFWVTLTTFDLPMIRRSAGPGSCFPDWDASRLRALLRISLPLGAALLLCSLNANLPRYFLQHYRGIKEVGIFSALAYVTISANLLVMALGQAFAPRMAKASTSNRSTYTRLSARLILVAASVGAAGLAGAVFAGQPLLQMFYGPAYAREYRVLVWLMLSGLVSHLASAVGYSLTSARYYGVQLPVLLAVCIVTAVSSVALVPAWGLKGAAVAQAAGYTAQFGGNLGYLVFAIRRGLLPSGEAVGQDDFALRQEV